MITSRARLAVAAVAAVALVSACGTSSTESAGSSESGNAASASNAAGASGRVTPRGLAEGKGSGAADGVFPRTVKHFQGATELKAEPKRVVVISTGQIDGVLTLGIAPVGAAKGDGAGMLPQYLSDAFPQQKQALSTLTDVGSRTAPSVETIGNLKPDLILMNDSGKDAKKLFDSLTAIAPTVVTKGTGLYWKQDFLLLADALGKTEQAQSILTGYESDAQKLGAGLATKPTVSFLRRNGDRMRVFGVASFAGSVAEDAGLPRPKDQQFTDETSVDVSAEQIEKADGDRLFYAVQGGDTAALTSLALWPTLTAVTENHAVAVDDDPFYLNAGPTAARVVLDTISSAVK